MKNCTIPSRSQIHPGLHPNSAQIQRDVTRFHNECHNSVVCEGLVVVRE